MNNKELLKWLIDVAVTIDDNKKEAKNMLDFAIKDLKKNTNEVSKNRDGLEQILDKHCENSKLGDYLINQTREYVLDAMEEALNRRHDLILNVLKYHLEGTTGDIENDILEDIALEINNELILTKKSHE